MSDIAAEVIAARERPGVFVLAAEPFARALVAVTGGDAQRWLDGMVTNDINAISEEGGVNGCYATLLTPKGRIVADLHVLAREDGYWLETAGPSVTDVIARLDKYIVADDVELLDRSAEIARLAVEGPGATALLEASTGASLLGLAPESWLATSLAGQAVVLARFGWSGEDAWQIFCQAGDGGPAAAASRAEALREALVSAGAEERSTAALEVLRVEAGIPRLGPELDDEVFPDEARLDSAISRTKGCYTGQEIVARLYSRGAVNHLLVALRFEGDDIPELGASLFAGDKKTGKVTSAVCSPNAGVVGLGYVRREHEEAGTGLRCQDAAGERAATVCALPIVAGSG